MSRGIGSRQRELLRAIDALPPTASLAVTLPGSPPREAEALRRAARGLVERGLAKALYKRERRDESTIIKLHLARPDSPLVSELLPSNAPAWITPAPLRYSSIGLDTRARLLTEALGRRVHLDTLRKREKELQERPAYALTSPAPQEAVRFVQKHHYSGSASPGTARYGWLDERGELVAVSIYDTGVHAIRQGVFGAEYASRVLHHHRLAVHPDVPHGTTSQFLAASLRALKRERPDLLAVVSYADATQGHHGTVYQATNATYTGLTTRGNLYFKTPDGELRTTQTLARYGTWPERRAAAKAMGWTEHRSRGKHRYLFLFGSAKRGRPALRWPVLPYPQRQQKGQQAA